jgi:chitin synthase
MISSFLACDPLHLLTSFLQYLLLAPTYINILNIYAFCNLHDFSWGTKGDTAVSKDLGSVVSTSKGTVEITLPTAQADIDTMYDEALNNLRTRPMIIRGDASNEEKAARQMDYYKNIRTNVVLAWALSIGVVAAFILNGDTISTFDQNSGVTRTKVYMVLVLVFVAGMACIRFIGSTVYLTIRLING